MLVDGTVCPRPHWKQRFLEAWSSLPQPPGQVSFPKLSSLFAGCFAASEPTCCFWQLQRLHRGSRWRLWLQNVPWWWDLNML